MRKFIFLSLAATFLFLPVPDSEVAAEKDVCRDIADLAKTSYEVGYTGGDCNLVAYITLSTASEEVGPALTSITKQSCDQGARDLLLEKGNQGDAVWRQIYQICNKALQKIQH